MWNNRLGTLPIVGTIACGTIVLFALRLFRHRFPEMVLEFDFLLELLLAGAVLLLATSAVTTLCVWLTTARQTASRNNNRTGFFISLLAASIVAMLILIDIGLARRLPVGSFVRPFDATIWRQSGSTEVQGGDITERQKMLGSVIRDVVQNGDRATIIKKLGPSEDTNDFSGLGPELVYVLGSERGFIPIDDEWLLIWFDHAGHTRRYEVTTD